MLEKWYHLLNLTEDQNALFSSYKTDLVTLLVSSQEGLTPTFLCKTLEELIGIPDFYRQIGFDCFNHFLFNVRELLDVRAFPNFQKSLYIFIRQEALSPDCLHIRLMVLEQKPNLKAGPVLPFIDNTIPVPDERLLVGTDLPRVLIRQVQSRNNIQAQPLLQMPYPPPPLLQLRFPPPPLLQIDCLPPPSQHFSPPPQVNGTYGYRLGLLGQGPPYLFDQHHHNFPRGFGRMNRYDVQPSICSWEYYPQPQPQFIQPPTPGFVIGSQLHFYHQPKNVSKEPVESYNKPNPFLIDKNGTENILEKTVKTEVNLNPVLLDETKKVLDKTVDNEIKPNSFLLDKSEKTIKIVVKPSPFLFDKTENIVKEPVGIDMKSNSLTSDCRQITRDIIQEKNSDRNASVENVDSIDEDKMDEMKLELVEKLKYLSKDDDKIINEENDNDIIIPYMKWSKEMTLELTEYSEWSNLMLKLPNNCFQIALLEKEMNEWYDEGNGIVSFKDLKIDGVYGAYITKMDSWCRIQLKTLMESNDQTSKVIIIDHGFTSWIQSSDIRKLKEIFCKPSRRSVECKITLFKYVRPKLVEMMRKFMCSNIGQPFYVRANDLINGILDVDCIQMKKFHDPELLNRIDKLGSHLRRQDVEVITGAKMLRAPLASEVKKLDSNIS